MMSDELKEVSPAPEEKKSTLTQDAFLLLHDLVYVMAVVTVLFVFVLRLVTVDGYSMYPTLVNEDYVALMSNVLYQDIKPGDVVVANVPTFQEGPIVKRVIAVEGQTVDIDFIKGIVYVDGVALEEPYIYEPTHHRFYEDGVTFPLTVEPGCVFVLGDNRNDSRDSRYAPIGQIDTRYILGRVVFVMLPGADRYQGDTKDFHRIGGVS